MLVLCNLIIVAVDTGFLINKHYPPSYQYVILVFSFSVAAFAFAARGCGGVRQLLLIVISWCNFLKSLTHVVMVVQKRGNTKELRAFKVYLSTRTWTEDDADADYTAEDAAREAAAHAAEDAEYDSSSSDAEANARDDYEEHTCECCICLETYKEGDLISSMKCGHELHYMCLLTWFKRNTICRCPMCNLQYRPEGA
jgi:hypothetical protein